MSYLTEDELKWLVDPQTERLVEAHLTDDPVRLALGLSCERERALMVCRQVKYLQRAKTKLPSYYAARCVIPPLSYEQCSSEATALLKAYEGELCIDLTCGLGVDSYAFSGCFGEVIAVERDPQLAKLARHNFARLGVENVRVECAQAEDFIRNYNAPKADLIYVDPARRSEEKRVFLLEDSSPNVLELMPLLLKKASRVVIKLSPLFDVAEALRLFAPRLARLAIVSVGNECKELLVECSKGNLPPEVAVILPQKRPYRFTPEQTAAPAHDTGENYPATLPYLLIPDVAFYKGRLVRALFEHYYPEEKIALPDQNGFAFAEGIPKDFPGRVYRITEALPYRPKALKKRLKEGGIKRANLLRRSFVHSTQEIKKALGIAEGGESFLAFTTLDGQPYAFVVEPEK